MGVVAPLASITAVVVAVLMLANRLRDAPLSKQKAYYKVYAELVARDLNQITLVSQQMHEAVSTKLQGLDAQFNFSFNTHPNWAEAWFPKK